ncbi:hypothetical protein BH20CHL6_BH20CHL6_12210 [soil metagenome]
MSPRVSLYKVLQVDWEAEPEVIQAAYRQLARKYHPDIDPSPQAASRMTAINDAWGILRDAERRAEYDRKLLRERDRRKGDRVVRPSGFGAAGPPRGPASGSVLDFGRYAGWSLGQIARHDLEFLEWLERMPIGLRYRDEIDLMLRDMGVGTGSTAPEPRRSRFGR